MITAIFIQDGVMQLVLTPETEYEKGCLQQLGNSERRAQMFKGGFYACAGGWYRQTREFGLPFEARDKDDASLIIRLDKETAISGHP